MLSYSPRVLKTIFKYLRFLVQTKFIVNNKCVLNFESRKKIALSEIAQTGYDYASFCLMDKHFMYHTLYTNRWEFNDQSIMSNDLS
mgnify:CR=1 FL=1